MIKERDDGIEKNQYMKQVNKVLKKEVKDEKQKNKIICTKGVGHEKLNHLQIMQIQAYTKATLFPEYKYISGKMFWEGGLAMWCMDQIKITDAMEREIYINNLISIVRQELGNRRHYCHTKIKNILMSK